tara:strand:- start:911 stop:1711 length:801 start_codon:yes stop_codon:yes gene_type:complete
MHVSFLKKFTFFLCLVGGFFLMGCSDEQTSSVDKEGKIIEIVMGTSADMPPFEFYEASEIVGYDIDIAKAIAKEMGFKLQVRDMDFSALIPALQSGRVDFVMASMTPTPEREKSIDFSEPYLTLPLAAMTLEQDAVTTQKGLSKKRVGVQLGSTHEQFARDVASRDKTVKVRSLNKLSELVQELISGRLDVLIMETKTAKAFQQVNPNLKVAALEDNTVSFALAFPKDSKWREKFNVAIEKLQISGRLDEIRAAWFSDYKNKLKGL